MSPAVAQRLITLTAIALFAVVVGLAIASSRDDSSTKARLPERVGPWYHARAAPMSRSVEGTTTACGVRLRASTVGLADPVLPCGAKLYVGYGNQDVLTQVIATGPSARGVRFGLTESLARDLGIEGPVTVRWSYAR